MLTKIFGSRNSRLVKQMSRVVESINALESSMQALSDDELKAKTPEFRQRFSNGETLDQLLPEAFAAVREAGVRGLGLRHFDVQLIGGMVLHNGKISEMKTGEGKTLVATLPAYLNSLIGESVHVVTVNDYLASRDAAWMAKLYERLGISVGVVVSGQTDEDKRAAYQCEIVYGTNNEYGFDYLRDNMKISSRDRVQGALSFSIVDEVDSILIDEARTPLIISGPAEGATNLYQSINSIVPKLTVQHEEDGPGDYSVDEKSRQITLTEEGHENAERLLEEAGLLDADSSLYDVTNIALLHHVYAALRAHAVFKRDVDYIVRNGEIVIIDEFTGRMMAGRRWSEGLHQAVEAKEGVTINQENQTLASITFQNYFRLYDKLSGMTGTADTEAEEFQQIYGLECVVIPTHRAMIRDDAPDLVYRTEEEKFDAIEEAIKECRAKDQPVLVGTASIDSSERLSAALTKGGIAHEVLNAKQHEREAQIIAQAGSPGAVTIATNMAGRGTDIVLGGSLDAELAELGDDAEIEAEKIRAAWQVRHDAVKAAGGLHVLGTERNESRRVDNQLRGRSGRQGDPGSSRFFVSLEDNLMRIFASERVSNLMQKLGMEHGEAIEHPWVTKAIENAQKKVEGHNFDIRKQLLEFDDVANEQRKVIYEQRNALMEHDDISQTITETRTEVVDSIIDEFIPPQSLEEQWDVPGLEQELTASFGLDFPVAQWLKDDDELYEETLRRKIEEQIVTAYNEKEQNYGPEIMRHLEKAVMLEVLDEHWKEHLANMDHLRQGIHLRGYAQKNPKQEYKREAFEIFTDMLEGTKRDVIVLLSRVQIQTENDVEEMERRRREQDNSNMEFVHADAAEAAPIAAPPPQGIPGAAPAGAAAGVAGSAIAANPQSGDTAVAEQPFVRDGKKVGRNEKCPCGSGKKFKQCHGKLA